jgi:hypothetical protein
MHRKRYLTALTLGALLAAGIPAETLLTTEKAVELAIKNN